LAVQQPPRALFRQVNLDSLATIHDFAAQSVSQRSFAQRYRVKVTPTLLVLGPDGTPLAAPIIGMRLPDFYGQYVSQLIDEAQRGLQQR
jgi:hypothetical protein